MPAKKKASKGFVPYSKKDSKEKAKAKPKGKK